MLHPSARLRLPAALCPSSDLQHPSAVLPDCCTHLPEIRAYCLGRLCSSQKYDRTIHRKCSPGLGVSKAALISMTRTLAVELGPAAIRVNCIAPGLVETRFSSVLVQNDELVRRYTERAALGRYGAPDEVAGAALWLASDESRFVTGQVIHVDGGYTMA